MIEQIVSFLAAAFVSIGGIPQEATVDIDWVSEEVDVSVVKVIKKPRRTIVRDPKVEVPERDLEEWRSVCGMSDSLEEIRVCGTRPDPVPPDTTIEDEVRRASRRIGVPSLRVHVEPAPEALVNIDTILHTEADTFTRDVVLLGVPIRIEAVPSRYTWHHGDGTSQRTRSPGRPWPDTSVTHRYTRAAPRVALSVDTTYRIRYRLGDGSWHTLPDTLTIDGPTTVLQVREARPTLTHP